MAFNTLAYRLRSVVPALLMAVVIAFAGAMTYAADTEGRVTQRMENFSLPHYKEGKLVWKVNGSVAYILDNRNIVLQDPRLLVTEGDDKPGYNIRADKATVTDNRSIVKLEGNVEVVGTDHSCLRAGDLIWNAQAETAETESRATMSRENMNLAGTGLKVYTTARSFEMGSDVVVTLPGEKLATSASGDVTIESEGRMTFAAGIATFFGRPLVSSGESRILSDRLELHLEEKTEALKKGVAQGNVDISSPEMTGKCEYAEWSPEDDQVHMSDNVFLRDKTSGNTVRSSWAKAVLTGNHIWCGGPVDALFYPNEDDK